MLIMIEINVKHPSKQVNNVLKYDMQLHYIKPLNL